MTKKNQQLTKLGFSFRYGGTHTSRTIMLDELKALLTYVDQPRANKDDYRKAIIDENCLAKRTITTRALTYKHMAALYSLDRSKILFRALLYYWNLDLKGQPLLALLCANARDPILQSVAPFILQFPKDTPVAREAVEELIDSRAPGRFSKTTLTSTAQNINSSLTKSGHLSGTFRKTRSQATPTATSVSYALLLGYLKGVRGQELFQTEHIKLLDCPFDTTIELAKEASRRGWLVLNQVEDVIEVIFPNLINQQEREWLREQT